MRADTPLRRVAREERRSWIVGLGLVALFLLLRGGDPAPPEAMTEPPPGLGGWHDVEVRP